MTWLFEELKQGLEEALAYEKGMGEARVHRVMFEPVEKLNKDEIKAIRNKTGLSQSMFASLMGVSKKTVEAWECGRNHPTGPALRLMWLIDTGELDCSKIVKREIVK